MSKKTLLMLAAAASLCAGAPAFAQPVQPDPSQPGGYPLPEGSGKKLVQYNCVSCHDLRRVVISSYSDQEWDNVVNMMKSAGAPLSTDEVKVVADYLKTSFPGKPKPAPVVIAGPVQVTFKEWPLPTPGLASA
jgi:virginiamycin B lyase